MAESIVYQANTEQPVIHELTDLAQKNVQKTLVVISGTVDPDSSPTDTTVYTVPAGKTLYVYEIHFSRQDAGGQMSLDDEAGDSTDGSRRLISFPTATAGYTPTHITLPSGLAFERGITIDSVFLGGQKAENYLIIGYLL